MQILYSTPTNMRIGSICLAQFRYLDFCIRQKTSLGIDISVKLSCLYIMCLIYYSLIDNNLIMSSLLSMIVNRLVIN